MGWFLKHQKQQNQKYLEAFPKWSLLGFFLYISDKTQNTMFYALFHSISEYYEIEIEKLLYFTWKHIIFSADKWS